MVEVDCEHCSDILCFGSEKHIHVMYLSPDSVESLLVFVESHLSMVRPTKLSISLHCILPKLMVFGCLLDFADQLETVDRAETRRGSRDRGLAAMFLYHTTAR